AAVGRPSRWYGVGARTDQTTRGDARWDDRRRERARRRYDLHREDSGGLMARILVVEDDLWSRRLVFELLVLRGHDVLFRAGVGDGRAPVSSVKFDAVILDINITGGGGAGCYSADRYDH